MRPRALVLATLALMLAALVPLTARAAEWDTIAPGTTTTDTARAQLGDPTRTAALKIEGYDASQWVYEGDRAPRGARKLELEFGLLTESGYKRDVLRLFRLDPTPGVFTRETILLGWGFPTRVGKDGDTPVFYYDEGLVVFFDKDGWIAQRMIFTPHQPQAKQ